MVSRFYNFTLSIKESADISDVLSDLFLCYRIKGRQYESMLPFGIEESLRQKGTV